MIRLGLAMEPPGDLTGQSQVPVAGQVGAIGAQGQPVALIGRLVVM